MVFESTRGPNIDDPSGIRWSSILAGVFVFFALFVVLTTVVLAIALSVVPIEAGKIPSYGTALAAGAVLVCGILASFFAAGYIAGLPVGYEKRPNPILHGLLAWAVVSALGGVAIGGRLVVVTGGLFAGRSASTLVDEMNPRVVSDLKINGTITSRVVTDKVPEGFLGAVKELGDRFEEISADPKLRRTAEQLRHMGAGASWVSALILVAGAASAAAGSTRAGGRSVLSVRRRRSPSTRPSKVPAS